MTRLDGSVRVVARLLLVAVLATSGCVVPLSTVTPSDETWQLSGTISNITGGRIAGARLIVLNGPNKDMQVTTDSEGRFVFANLENSAFDVLIEATGFTSITPRVNLFRAIDVSFVLSAA